MRAVAAELVAARGASDIMMPVTPRGPLFLSPGSLSHRQPLCPLRSFFLASPLSVSSELLCLPPPGLIYLMPFVQD